MTEHLPEIPGPVLLLAGPGTGKTHQLALRVKYLLEVQRVPPDQITVVTFTGPAAQNMRERISDPRHTELYIPPALQPKRICTMHSLGHRILREDMPALGLRGDLDVVSDTRQVSLLLGDAAQTLGFERDRAEQVLQCRQLGDCSPRADSSECQICNRYRAILHSWSAIDHDDQLFLACRLLREEPGIRVKIQAATKQLLVDEYQDINAAQYELIRLLSAGQEEGLFVVGDDDQSIYSWRGGSPTYIRRFREDFGPEAHIHHLTTSRRCHPNILESATGIVERFDSERLGKEPYEYIRKTGPKIQVHNTASDQKEAREVRRIINGTSLSESILILVPSRRFLPALTQELRRAHIPFATSTETPGTGLVVVSALARWLSEPNDSLALRLCLESFLDSPVRGLPSRRARTTAKVQQRENATKRIAALWGTVLQRTPSSLWEALCSVEEEGITGEARLLFAEILGLHSRDESIEAFFAALCRTLTPWRKTQQLLGEVGAWVDYASQGSDSGQIPRVRLMTLQAAKGLEADVVCIVGLEEGILPKAGTGSIAEESRLLYVSMTRSRNELHLLHARKRSGAVSMRNQFKGGRPDIAVSRFIEVLPRERCEMVYHPA